MGEYRRKLIEAAEARARAMKAGQPQEMKLNVAQSITVVQLDLACHCLMGFAVVLGQNYKQTEAADVLQKCVETVQAYKEELLRKAAQRIILAKASDVPRRPPTLVQP